MSEPKKVYVLVGRDGNSSWNEVVGAFSTREAAETYLLHNGANYSPYELEEVPLDDLQYLHHGWRCLHVHQLPLRSTGRGRAWDEGRCLDLEALSAGRYLSGGRAETPPTWTEWLEDIGVKAYSYHSPETARQAAEEARSKWREEHKGTKDSDPTDAPLGLPGG